jgi:hypothetical protein
VGKTQVALELAHRTREKYPQCSVIWMPTNIANVQRAFIDVARKLGIDVTPTDKEDVNVQLLAQPILVGTPLVGGW